MAQTQPVASPLLPGSAPRPLLQPPDAAGNGATRDETQRRRSSTSGPAQLPTTAATSAVERRVCTLHAHCTASAHHAARQLDLRRRATCAGGPLQQQRSSRAARAARGGLLPLPLLLDRALLLLMLPPPPPLQNTTRCCSYAARPAAGSLRARFCC